MATPSSPTPVPVMIKMIEVDQSTGAKLAWPSGAGECRIRDSLNRSWWIGTTALWEGAPEYEILSKLYPKGNIKIEITRPEEYNIYDRSTTKRIVAGEGESLTDAEVLELLSKNIVAMDEDSVEEILRLSPSSRRAKRVRNNDDDDNDSHRQLKKVNSDTSELANLPKGQSYPFYYAASTNVNFEHAMMSSIDSGKCTLPPHFAVFNIRYAGREGLYDEWKLEPSDSTPSLSGKNPRMDVYLEELKLKDVAPTDSCWNLILAISTRERVILNTKIISPKLFAQDYAHLIDNHNGDTKLSVHTATFFDPRYISPKHFSSSALEVDSPEDKMRTILSNWTDCVGAKENHFGHSGWKFVHNVYYP